MTVSTISPETHLQFIADRGQASFLQTPAWAGVKAEWGSRSLGWFDQDRLIGVALVLTRNVPKSKYFLAYIPEGPVLDLSTGAADLLQPALDFLKSAGAFMVKMGPTVPVRRWSAATLKAAIADGSAKRLRDVEPDDSYSDGLQLIKELQAAGWTQQADTGAGFGDVQPRYVFQIPLAGRSEDEVFAGFNQLWRRNIRKATKLGVQVERGTREDLAKFHPVYVETAHRDGFVPRGLEYFERMWNAMSAEDPDRIRLYLASHEGQVLAATTMVTVGSHAWYSYGASADAGREVKPSNAIQWKMITDSLVEGRNVYDMRGISDTLDESDPLFGLIRFKLGTGGQAIEYVGEWDYALRPAVARAFNLYMRRAEIKNSARNLLRRKGNQTPEGSTAQ